jgi:predicted acyltransferase
MNQTIQNNNFINLSSKRNISIDVFKGLAIVLTIFIDCTSYFNKSPSWNKGTPDFGLNYVDIIAPLFVFALAVNFKSSFYRRVNKKGKLETYIHFVRRSLILIVIGFLITVQVESGKILLRWGTLQMLGMVSLIYLLFVNLKWIIKVAISIFLIFFHQLYLLTNYKSVIDSGAHGGIIGSFAWVSILIFSAIVTEDYAKNNKILVVILIGTLLIILSFLVAPIWGFNRNLITIPFILISVGISSIIFYAVIYLFEILENDFRIFSKDNFLSILGKNTLILYIILAYVKYIPYILFPIDIDFFFVILIGLLFVVLNILVAYLLHREEIYVKI